MSPIIATPPGPEVPPGPITPQPAPDLTPWTAELRLAALREGWLLSETDTATDGPLLVQCVDWPGEVAKALELDFVPPRLSDDGVAWQVLRAGQQRHHEVAMALLTLHNPGELQRVLGA